MKINCREGSVQTLVISTTSSAAVTYSWAIDGVGSVLSTSNPIVYTPSVLHNGKSLVCVVTSGVESFVISVPLIITSASELPIQNTTFGMTNLYLNPTTAEEWDIVIDESGQLVTITDVDYISQKLQQFLQTVKGEVYTDVDYGIPYFENILGIKNPNLSNIKQLFISEILENQTLLDLGVTNCEINSIELDTESRILSIVGLEVTTKYSDTKLEIARLAI